MDYYREYTCGIGAFLHLLRVTDKRHQDDCQLLNSFVERQDEAAFQALVARYGSLVYARCRSILRSIEDAEDAFQETFKVLARKAHQLTQAKCLASWLFEAARRISVKMVAKKGRRSRLAGQEILVTDQIEDVNAREDEFTLMLFDELDRLPDKYRTPILICALGGRRHQEAARILGCSIAELERRLARGRQLLRERLQLQRFEASSSLSIATLPVEQALVQNMTASFGPRLIKRAVEAAVVSSSVPSASTIGSLTCVLGDMLGQASGNRLLQATACLLLGFAAAGGVISWCWQQQNSSARVVSSRPVAERNANHAVSNPGSLPPLPGGRGHGEVARAKNYQVSNLRFETSNLHSPDRALASGHDFRDPREQILRDQIAPKLIASLEELSGSASTRETYIDSETQVAHVLADWKDVGPLKDAVVRFDFDLRSQTWTLSTDLFTGEMHVIDPDKPIILTRMLGYEYAVQIRQIADMRQAFLLLER